MSSCDERLRELQSLIDAKPHMLAVFNDLCRQKQALEKKVWDLNYIRMNEQSDVDRLEEPSIRSVILALLGKKEDRLERERAELAAAILKHDLARKELDALEALIAEKQQMLNQCISAEAEYDRVLREKAERIAVMGGADADEISGLRGRIVELETRLIELSEAMEEGRKAMKIAGDALESLGSAGNWSTLDLFCDSMIFDLAKYGAMDDAKALIERLQFQLRRFRAELADVAMDANAEVETGGMFRFADYFFDDIFTAISSMNRIDRAKDSVYTARLRIHETLRALEQQEQDARIELSNLQNHLKNRILEAKA